MTTVTKTDAAPWVVAAINYVHNDPEPGTTLTFVTADERRSTMLTLPGRDMSIENVRGTQTDLEREGFKLVPHVSAVNDFELIEEDPGTDALYRKEIAKLLRETVGASRIIMLGGGKKRFGESATDKLANLRNAKPARYPHTDNTDVSAAAQAEMMASFAPDVDLGSFKRWALYNVWRAVTPPPQDFPLAVCDAQTVTGVDEVTVTALSLERQGEVRHDTTGGRYNAAHRWCYFRDMTRDEVLIFKSGESDPSRVRRVFHTAFTDPTCPPDTPTRGSVESRALALFA